MKIKIYKRIILPVVLYGCKTCSLKILTDTPTGKRPLGRPRRRWQDNIRMNLKEIGFNTSNWVHLAQDRGFWRALVKAALKVLVP